MKRRNFRLIQPESLLPLVLCTVAESVIGPTQYHDSTSLLLVDLLVDTYGAHRCVFASYRR